MRVASELEKARALFASGVSSKFKIRVFSGAEPSRAKLDKKSRGLQPRQMVLASFQAQGKVALSDISVFSWALLCVSKRSGVWFSVKKAKKPAAIVKHDFILSSSSPLADLAAIRC